MALNDKALALAPYAEQLLANDDVQDALRRAVAATQEAYGRAQGKSPPQAMNDRKLWSRLQEAATAASEAWSEATAPPRKPRRLRKLVLLALAGGGVFLAVNGEARAAVLELFGQKQSAASN